MDGNKNSVQKKEENWEVKTRDNWNMLLMKENLLSRRKRYAGVVCFFKGKECDNEKIEKRIKNNEESQVTLVGKLSFLNPTR